MDNENPTPSPEAGASIESEAAGNNQAADASMFDQAPPTEEAGAEGSAPEKDNDLDGVSADPEKQPETISAEELAGVLGLSQDQLDITDDGLVKIRSKIDGKESTVTFEEAVRSHQKSGHLDNEIRKAKQQSEEAKQQAQQYRQAEEQKLAQIESLSQVALEELNREFKDVNWEALKELEPAQFAAKSIDFQQRQQRITQTLSAIQQDRQQKQAQAERAYIEEQSQKLVEAYPEWQDEAKGKKELADIRNHGLTLGYSKDELARAVDHRFIKMMDKAKRYDELMSKQEETRKTVKTIPRVAKAGVKRDTEKPKSDADYFY